MSDSPRKPSLAGEIAQPFLYAPPSGEKSRGSAVSARSPVFGGSEISSDYSSYDQTLQKAYDRGFSEGQAQARADSEKATTEMRSQISTAVRYFSIDRAEYFARVEAEVVRLSLSIAKKILHRESQIDPLLLTGVVHVALQKLNSETRVRLRAPSDEVRYWNDYFKQSKDIFPVVEVVGDPSLASGHCTLETDFGSTEISLDVQLKEIEQGFFDLLERRPREGE